MRLALFIAWPMLAVGFAGLAAAFMLGPSTGSSNSAVLVDSAL